MSARAACALAVTLSAGAVPASAQLVGCNTPTTGNTIWQEGYQRKTTASVKTVRNFDLCPWQSRVEAWQGAYYGCVVPPLIAQEYTAAVVSWSCEGSASSVDYGERAQSRGKHWLIKYYFDWESLGETTAEVTLARAPGTCDSPDGPGPTDCGDECDSDGSREDACVRDGGTWDASQCSCVYPQECDSDAEARCNDLCGTWDSEQCECAGGSSESDRELCENDDCTWKPDCWCDCGERPDLSKKSKRRPLASLFGQSNQVACGTSANAFARALAGR